MTEVTQKKIDAMVEKRFKSVGLSNAGTCPFFFKEAATPWAEWCERFEIRLEGLAMSLRHHGQNINPTFNENWIKDLLDEYRLWLEQTDV